MNSLRVRVSAPHRAVSVIALCAGALVAGQAGAGGIIAYEIGTADVGLAWRATPRARRTPRPSSPTPPG